MAIPLFGIFFGIWDKSGWEAGVSLLCAIPSGVVVADGLRIYNQLCSFAGLIILIGFLFVVFAHFIPRVMNFYKRRQKVINTLLLTSFVLANLYIIFAPITATFRWTNYVGASIIVCIIAVAYGIIRKYLGLVKVACGVLIFDSWFFVSLSSAGIVVGIFATAILLIVLGQLLPLMKR